MAKIPFNNWFDSLEEYSAYRHCLNQIQLGDRVDFEIDRVSYRAAYGDVIFTSAELRSIIPTASAVIDVRPERPHWPRFLCIGLNQQSKLGESPIRYFDTALAVWNTLEAEKLQNQFTHYLWLGLNEQKITKIYKRDANVLQVSETPQA